MVGRRYLWVSFRVRRGTSRARRSVRHQMQFEAWLLSQIAERVQYRYTQLLEVTDVSGDDSQPLGDGNGGNQGILQQRVRSSMHEPRPFPEGGGI